MESSENSNVSDASSSQEIDAETKAKLETELKSWSASSAEELFEAAETEREYKFSTPPDWKCIICKKMIKSDSVYQCQTGLACHACSQSGVNCSSCSKAISRIKNLAVENMTKSLVVTCKFTNLGCKEVFNYRDVEHEKNCSFAPMVCPMPGCSQDSKELHLLRQESSTFEDTLQITSLAESCKRKYELDVTISEEQITYRQIKLYLIQEERGLPFPKELNSILEEEDCEIVDVVIPENSVPQEGSDGKIGETENVIKSNASNPKESDENENGIS